MLASPEKLSAQRSALERDWLQFMNEDAAIQALAKVGLFSEVHADFVDGVFTSTERDETDGPDSFEVEIGNFARPPCSLL